MPIGKTRNIAYSVRSGLRACIAIAGTLLSTDAYSAAWTQEKGDGQAIASGLYSNADEAFDDAGKRAVDYENGAVSLLIDYGLLEGLTLNGKVEIGSDTDGDLPYRRPALSEASAGARLQLYRSDRFAMSGEIAVLTRDAFGDQDGLVDTFGWNAPLLEARWSGGTNFAVYGLPAFADVSPGYRYRVGDGPDEIVFDAALGLRATEDLMVLAQSFSTISAGEDPSPYDYHKAQGSFVYDLNAVWSVQTGAFTTVSGKNALEERGAFTALWLRF